MTVRIPSIVIHCTAVTHWQLSRSVGPFKEFLAGTILFFFGRGCPTISAIRTAQGALRSSNNAYFLRLIYFCPGKKIKVISAVPGIELLGPYRRINDKSFIQRIAIDCGPENILLLAIDLAYAPGQSGRFCRGQNLF
jgi:hypothetical protein